jgi:hypothetical protein
MFKVRPAAFASAVCLYLEFASPFHGGVPIIYEHRNSQLHWQDDSKNKIWLELPRPFAAVKNLYLSKELARHIAPALTKLVGGRITKILPTLQNLFLEGLPSGPTAVPEYIEQFVSGDSSPWKGYSEPF